MPRMVAQPAADARAALRAEAERIASAPQAGVEEITRAGATALQLGMAREADTLFGRALQLLGHFIARRDAQRALATEVAIYNTFVKAIEDEGHYERCFALWRDAMAGLGSAFAQPSPPAQPDGDLLRVGFVFHTGIVLGHTEVLLRLLQRRDRSRVAPRVYAIFGHDAEFLARVEALDVPVETYAGGAEGPHDWLRRRMAANGEATAVWVSAPPAALFMFGARVAPVQVFWSLKYHPIRAPQIDGYLTYGSWGEAERTFHGQRWIVCPVPLALDPRPADASLVQALRARFPQRFLMGTLAREEKIDSRPFLESVVALLKRHPEAGYLWTGHARHAGIDAFFRAQGVAERCHFVGWVDTPLYAAALDLFLETFPLGCGVTGYQALGAGRPLVSYLEPNTIFGMQYWSELAGGAAPTREKLDQYPVLAARDPREYVELASRLVTDPDFREHWRGRGQRFHDEEVAGIERYSKRFFDTIAAIRPSGQPS